MRTLYTASMVMSIIFSITATIFAFVGKIDYSTHFWVLTIMMRLLSFEQKNNYHD